MPPPATLVADPFFPRLKALVIETTGMAFYADKDDDLAAIVSARMAEIGAGNCLRYLDLICDPERGGAEMDALVAELTIGETYFFRHKEQFDALRDLILPDVLARNAPFRRLRIWSAGCATGPEPYSLAIMLRREFGAQIAGWHVAIVGTDINQKFLARAREGRYDEWAFRAVPDDLRRDCFEKVGRQWVIRPEYKSFVTFQYHNLIRNRFPSLVDNIAAFDIVICRNVIIYFSPETVRELVPCFRESLIDGGWLVMGHAEPNQELFRSFRTVNAPGAVLYQRLDNPRTEPAPPAAIVRPAPPPPPPPPPPPQARLPKALPTRAPSSPAPLSPPLPVSPRPAPPALDRVRELADLGRWEEALAACDGLIATDALDAGAHFLRALIVEQMGDLGACETALRRTIYLDRQAVLAHYHLGLFLARRGDSQGARRSFRNVLALLERLDADSELENGDHLTAGQLRETVAMHLSSIGET
ncbi:protein-glutamate O-methyltransferase CheR [Magnetospirillum sp. UT-4]|uniref:CheR family methyltransferase n=1 Tax=Magnetospirillum sp. UT-4 TaxID=2681467 RepID=UPI0020C2D0A1|nr:protein-glutamate O-methyltransferase CheR [Magnetospirillum sp. UT-4]